MKAYTDIKQSKKLAEILSPESSDMFWREFSDGFYFIETEFPKYEESPKGIRCWSLAALINVIKPVNENTYTIRGTRDGGAIISFDEATCVMFQEKEMIDAVFEMVVWLKEIGKL